MIRLSNLKVPLDYTPSSLLKAAEAKLNARGLVESARVAKKSVDARDKGDVHFVMALDVALRGDEKKVLARLPRGVQAAPARPEPVLRPISGARFENRPVVVGLGPAGLFAAYTLALSGARPIVVERGQDVARRAAAVASFWSGGAFNPRSNVQFGEGGAGAFSDGKLTTGISDPRCAMALRILCECGAPEEILYLAKPHIGTDRLPGVVKALREKIVSLGGEVRFETRLVGLEVEGGRIAAAILETADGARETLPADGVVLAIGHSARDTFEALNALGVRMARKPFSIGARIEHSQKMIDRSQYGAAASHPALGAADYKLSVRLPNGRSAYTFCMCPGGQVVAAASEAGGVVTNGMSAFARDGQNANSALLVGVEPEDFGGDDPLAGVRFQRLWEKAAFELGGGDYRAPAQRAGDFLRGVRSTGCGDVEPTYRPGVTYADLSECLPGFVTETMRLALQKMDRQLAGFASPGALLTGVETRSSSPVRILRGDDCQSVSLRGLFPCGEGAGYAGGILSAAVDGMRVAEALLGAHGGAISE
ncbi:MAG: FAD-binding protein [Clostridia bacterium]|nr:FAD-binding protein [Clostridia bacterium]